ncbi:MAG: DegV family protein [Lachnospiraceae bacterium]|nr:DegV family protein [Lachnospiraceae bacterium]
MKFNIVVDSSCDLRKLETSSEDIGFSHVPLSIIVGNDIFVDDENLDTSDMIDKIYSYKGKTGTACPSPEAWYNKFMMADEIIAITITGSLSGSYNSACLAKTMVLEKHPDKKIHVIDSLSTGPEMSLIAKKAAELAASGKDFYGVCSELEEYRKSTHLLFVLKSLENLAKNGRVSKAVAKVAGILNIQVVGIASSEGTLKLLSQCRGASKTYAKIIEEIKQRGYKGGKIILTHCLNEKAAEALKTLFIEALGASNIDVMPSSGLCCYYAEKGGLLIGFEA